MTTLKSHFQKIYINCTGIFSFLLTGHAFLLPLAPLNVNVGEFAKVTVVANSELDTALAEVSSLWTGEGHTWGQGCPLGSL